LVTTNQCLHSVHDSQEKFHLHLEWKGNIQLKIMACYVRLEFTWFEFLSCLISKTLHQRQMRNINKFVLAFNGFYLFRYIDYYMTSSISTLVSVRDSHINPDIEAGGIR
jgi:hypothetical protein